MCAALILVALLGVLALHLLNDVRSGQYRERLAQDRKSTRLNSSHVSISYAVFCWKKKKDYTRLILLSRCRTADGQIRGLRVFFLLLHKAQNIEALYGAFLLNDTATTEIYTLSLHDALPI